jgi:hypothetical protein
MLLSDRKMLPAQGISAVLRRFSRNIAIGAPAAIVRAGFRRSVRDLRRACHLKRHP